MIYRTHWDKPHRCPKCWTIFLECWDGWVKWWRIYTCREDGLKVSKLSPFSYKSKTPIDPKCGEKL